MKYNILKEKNATKFFHKNGGKIYIFNFFLKLKIADILLKKITLPNL